MDQKFADIVLEPDTRLYSRTQLTLAGLDAVFDWWSWDGEIEGDSVIFCSEDVAAHSEEDLKAIVREHFKVKEGDFTFKRGPKYTFLNFNFR